MTRGRHQADAEDYVAALQAFRAKLRAAGRMLEARAVEACIRTTRAAARSKDLAEGVARGKALASILERSKASTLKTRNRAGRTPANRPRKPATCDLSTITTSHRPAQH